MWLKVLKYIDDNYELDRVERIYIAGDGANWIKKGLEWIPASKFVLDSLEEPKKMIVKIFEMDGGVPLGVIWEM